MLRTAALLILFPLAMTAQERQFDPGEQALAILSEHGLEAQRAGAKVILRQYRIAPGVRSPLTEVGDGLLLVQLRAGELATVIDGQRQERMEGEWWSVESASDMQFETEDDAVIIETILIAR
jgi:hypothetical protein